MQSAVRRTQGARHRTQGRKTAGHRTQGAGRTDIRRKSDESPTKISHHDGDGSISAHNTVTQLMALLLQRSNGVTALRNDGGACCGDGGGHFGHYSTTCFCNSQRNNVAALLHLVTRRCCNSQRDVATTYNAALLHLVTQRCCCGAVLTM